VIRSSGSRTDRVWQETRRLSAALELVGFEGWDPYDALSSPLLRAACRAPVTRQGAIQLFKRLPVNLRPLLGVRPRRHTKAVALCVSAYALSARSPDLDRFGALVDTLSQYLGDQAVVDHRGVGWAYDFDVQTRWDFYPAGKPNAVVTSFAMQALFAASALPEADPHLGALAEAAGRAAVERFVVDTPQGRFFAYHEGCSTPIHNANLLVASAVGRCTEIGADEWRAAESAVGFTVSRQREDGSWPYGEGRGLEWVDGYHTAYVLMSLARWVDCTHDPKSEAALDRGLRFYIDRLFEPSGAPRATTDRLYPIDIHSASSAIWALASLRDRSRDALPLAERVLDWTLAHMRKADGRYAFQLHAWYRNSISYIRWNDAHMLLALASLADAKRQDADR
jgi:hypothetical protein